MLVQHYLHRPAANPELRRTNSNAGSADLCSQKQRRRAKAFLTRSCALCSQAKWLERFNQLRLWKDAYLRAFHISHSASLVAGAAVGVMGIFPQKMRRDRDAHKEWARCLMARPASVSTEKHCPGRAASNPQVWHHSRSLCASVSDGKKMTNRVSADGKEADDSLVLIPLIHSRFTS